MLTRKPTSFGDVARPISNSSGRSSIAASSLSSTTRAVSDETDYTIPVHSERRGLIHVEIEIRQDLVANPEDQAAWVARLADLLPRALDRVVADYRSSDRNS